MTTINLGKIKPLYKGTYTGGVTYRPLDFTLYLGNLYVCKASSTGNLPTDPAYFDPVVNVNAASLPNTPSGSIAATTVQAAINELDSEKVAKTDVIAIARGGTGATTANAAADAIGAFRRGTLLGTVSQSAGVPTGAVIESGSNAHGEYVRFADGTQICTLTGFADVAIVDAAYNDIRTFPAAFAVVRTVSPAISAISTTYVFYGQVAANDISTTSAVISRRYDTAQTYTIGVVVVGRWF